MRNGGGGGGRTGSSEESEWYWSPLKKSIGVVSFEAAAVPAVAAVVVVLTVGRGFLEAGGGGMVKGCFP